MNDVTATRAAPPRWRQSLELWGRLTARGLLVLLLPLMAVVYGLFEAFALFATSQGPEAGYPLSLYFAIFFLPGLGSLLALGLFLGPLLLWRSKAAFAPFVWHGQSWRWALGDVPIIAPLPWRQAIPLWWGHTWRWALLASLALLLFLLSSGIGPDTGPYPIAPILSLLTMATPPWRNMEAALRLYGMAFPLLAACSWLALYAFLRLPLGCTRLAVRQDTDMQPPR